MKWLKMMHLILTEGIVIRNVESFTLNPFSPAILMWVLPSLNLDMSTNAKRCFSLK